MAKQNRYGHYGSQPHINTLRVLSLLSHNSHKQLSFFSSVFIVFFLATTKLQMVSTTAGHMQHTTRPDLLHWQQDLLAAVSTVAALHFNRICFSGRHRQNPWSHEPSTKPIAAWPTRSDPWLFFQRDRDWDSRHQILQAHNFFQFYFNLYIFFMTVTEKWKWTKMN